MNESNTFSQMTPRAAQAPARGLKFETRQLCRAVGTKRLVDDVSIRHHRPDRRAADAQARLFAGGAADVAANGAGKGRGAATLNTLSFVWSLPRITSLTSRRPVPRISARLE
jgi:hypothetical protein